MCPAHTFGRAQPEYPTRWNNLRRGTCGFDYFDRAAGALENLFVHDRDEAEYFSTYEDGDAQLLVCFSLG